MTADSLRTPPIKLGLFEKAGVLVTLCKVAFASLLSIVCRTPPSLRLRFWYTLTRTLSASLTVRQQHYVHGYTDGVYRHFARKRGFKPYTIALKEGGLGHWIGNANAKNVIIYFHGGGFGQCANEALFEHATDLMDYLNSANKDVAVFFITYGLSPMTTYPKQHIQAVEAVRYILNETGRAPGNVVLGGDSAGGNLCLGILSHINHNHPAIEPLWVSEPFAAVFCSAPWVSFDITKPSMYTNRNKDFISPRVLKKWSDSFLGGKKSDYFCEGLYAPAEWWKGIQTREMLICCGKDDILFTGVDEFAQKIMSVCDNVTYFAADDEPHDVALIWRVAGEPRLSEQEKKVMEFLRELL